MISKLTKKIFGSRNQRILSRYKKQVNKINQLEESMAALSDADLGNKTLEFKQKLKAGSQLDELLPEAFAEAQWRGINEFIE